jgi:hypothetical protein
LPFTPSILINSLLNENRDQISTQLQIWHASTIFPAIKGKYKKGISEIYDWVKAHAREVDFENPELSKKLSSTRDWFDEKISEMSQEGDPKYFSILDDAVDFQASKFCQLLELSGKSIHSDVSIAELHELGHHVEQQAIIRLREKDKNFQGETLDDMVSYVVKTLIDDLMSRFDDLSDEEKDKLVGNLTHSFEKLDGEAKAIICEKLKTDEITEETVRRAINAGMLAGGIAGLVGISGFAAYTTITSVLSVLSFGLLPFSGYIFATSLLAFATKFYVIVPALLVGGSWLSSRANEKINDRLFPIFVSLTIISSSSQDRNRSAEIEFEEKFKKLNEESKSDEVAQRQLRDAFPCFEWRSQLGSWTSKLFSKAN